MFIDENRQALCCVCGSNKFKAFDLVQRSKLWGILKKTGIKGKVYNSLTGMHKSVKACVRTSTGLTDYFDCPIGLKQGCLASPILFSLFINELADNIENSGVRGVQLLPDLTEILLLMFADDLALISDSVVGLQKLLNILYRFCSDRGMIINIVKTIIVVFKKGGMLARNETWSLGGERIQVVPCFTYVGVNFTRQLSLIQMAKEQSVKGKRVLISILSKLYQYGQLPKEVFFKIFDTKICPILLYGSELWGIEKQVAIERVQTYACKRYMCVNLKTSNDAVLGDCGRYPMYIESTKRCLSYWLKILKMQDHRYVRKCYNMMRHYDQFGYTNWVTLVRRALHTNGFGYLWEQQEVTHEKLFLTSFIQRLRDQYLQQWFSDVSLSSKLCTYSSFKLSFTHECYLDSVTVRKFRWALASFRTSSHKLEVEVGRHSNRPKEERKCNFCKVFVEDEYHLLMSCPLYQDLRKTFLPGDFLNVVNYHNFVTLMNT